MSKDPARCCGSDSNGKACENKPMYKIGAKGFCEEHKPHRGNLRIDHAKLNTYLPPELR